MRSIGKIVIALAVMLLLTGIAWGYVGQNVAGSTDCKASFTETITAGVPTPISIAEAVEEKNSYGTGTASFQVDSPYIKTLTLSGAPQTIDLTNLTDPNGNALNLARVRVFMVQNNSSTAGQDCKIYQGSSNGWAPLPPNGTSNPLYARVNGAVYIEDPQSTGTGNGNVVTSTSKTVTFDPGSNTFTINVMIIGGSAAFVVVLPFGLRRYRHRRLAA